MQGCLCGTALFKKLDLYKIYVLQIIILLSVGLSPVVVVAFHVIMHES